MPAQLTRITRILILLLTPLLLILGGVRFLVTDQYLAFEYRKSSFPSDPYGFDSSERLTFASANFRYVRERQPLAALAGQQLNGAPLYNTRELNHMVDVQNVYQAVWLGWKIAAALFALAALAVALRRETRPALASALRTGGLLTAGLVGAVGLQAVVAWQAWFVVFHQVFFAAGSWTFEYTDTLIRLFPEKFWFDAAQSITGFSFLAGLLLALLTGRWQAGKRAPSTHSQSLTSQPQE